MRGGDKYIFCPECNSKNFGVFLEFYFVCVFIMFPSFYAHILLEEAFCCAFVLAIIVLIVFSCEMCIS